MKLDTTLKSTARISIVALLAMSLSGCLLGTSNGGGGGGGAAGSGGTAGGGTGGTGGGGSTAPASLAQVQSNIDNARTSTALPTTTPLTGTATYRGEVLLDQVLVTTQQGQNDVGDIAGDLEMEMNFAQGAANPITGTASNFRGQINGQDVTVTGTLSTANGSVNAITANTTTLPAPASGSITLTGMSVSLGGQISDGTAGGIEGDALLTLQGSPFRGPNGNQVWGVAGGGVDPFTSSGALVQWGGQYYLNRQ